MPDVKAAFEVVDKYSSTVRSRMMSRVRSTNTKPELKVRRLLHSRGYRFQVHKKDLPGRPDIVFSRKRKIIEIRGCFWHQHPDPNCSKATIPDFRREWWAEKLHKTVLRDERNYAELTNAGWKLLILWECDLKNISEIEPAILQFLGPPRSLPQ